MQAERYALPVRHPLYPFVHGIWQVRTAEPYWHQRVLPTGIVDLLFPLEGTLVVTEAHVSDRPKLHGGPFLVGLQSRAVGAEAQGALFMLGLSLRAETSRAILSCPVHEVTNLTIPAGDVLATASELFGRLHDARTFGERCGILLRWLTQIVRTSARLTRVEHACALLCRSTDVAVFDRAAATVGCSSRHLRRTFLDYVGTTPAEYRRLRRFRRALNLMGPAGSLTEVAQSAGYYDQAHLCRDFKEFAALTPGAYRARAGLVPGVLFSTDVRLIQAPTAAIA
jgi:AraC-like DNA-binding protein